MEGRNYYGKPKLLSTSDQHIQVWEMHGKCFSQYWQRVSKRTVNDINPVNKNYQPEQWNKSSQRDIVKHYEFGVSSQEIASNIYNLTNLESNKSCIRTCPPVNFPGLNVTQTNWHSLHGCSHSMGAWSIRSLINCISRKLG